MNEDSSHSNMAAQPVPAPAVPVEQLRRSLGNEWHARPLIGQSSPLRCSHMVLLRGETSLDERREQFAAFCDKHGQSTPAQNSRHHSVQIGNCLLKWEGHTEADSYTLLVAGNSEPAFAKPALDFLDRDLRDALREELFLGVHIEVMVISATAISMAAPSPVGSLNSGHRSSWTPMDLCTSYCWTAVWVRSAWRAICSECWRLKAIDSWP